jgi:hypothetical protein
MIDWSLRPFEERNLFNPAFCAVVLASALRAYQKEVGTSMPYSLALLVLPLCLHQGTRNEICACAISRISVLRMFARRPDLLIDFAKRAQSLVQHANEAFALLASRDCIFVGDDGGVGLRPRKVSPAPLNTTDAEKCRIAATTLGRHFARINDRATIYTTLSIRP